MPDLDDEIDEINAENLDDREPLKPGASANDIKRKKMILSANKEMQAAEASGQSKALGDM